MDTIRIIPEHLQNNEIYKKHISDCVVLIKDNKILLQQRPENYGISSGHLTAFGGHVEENESPLQGLIRELREELGANALEKDLIKLGALTEDFTNHAELVHVYFWHDRQGTITGCYECLPTHYDNVAQALNHPKVMPYLRWALTECLKRKLLP